MSRETHVMLAGARLSPHVTAVRLVVGRHLLSKQYKPAGHLHRSLTSGFTELNWTLTGQIVDHFASSTGLAVIMSHSNAIVPATVSWLSLSWLSIITYTGQHLEYVPDFLLTSSNVMQRISYRMIWAWIFQIRLWKEWLRLKITALQFYVIPMQVSNTQKSLQRKRINFFLIGHVRSINFDKKKTELGFKVSFHVVD